jgi:hypothetical protein
MDLGAVNYFLNNMNEKEKYRDKLVQHVKDYYVGRYNKKGEH